MMSCKNQSLSLFYYTFFKQSAKKHFSLGLQKFENVHYMDKELGDSSDFEFYTITEYVLQTLGHHVNIACYHIFMVYSRPIRVLNEVEHDIS